METGKNDEMLRQDFQLSHNRDPYFRTMEFHAHDFLELYYFLDGSVTYYIEDQVYDLCPGDLLIIPAGKMHRPVIANEHAAYERMVLWITPQYLQSIDSPAGDLQKNLQKVGEHGYCVPFRGDETVFVTALLKKLLYMQKNDIDPKFCAGAVELYLWTIFRSYGVIDTTHRNETQVIPQVIRYITEHFSEPLTLEDIAAEFFVSKSYLNRHFKAYTNSTVYAYIMALRLTHARRMLREGIPAVEAGRECGFSDYSTFYKAFKTQTGLSPQQFKSRA
ncbi:AraC family transcriptional regulator [Neglectibacter sp. CSJ-5]|uniref:AraC family transcriptional regulator n=1 Tax=Neglectibacter sp. CSJ-5 TaxID=3078043 RepID=UPI00292E03B1|nr:AraC family transcriptional regulator [Neglectibacter sp. CSJ-5]